MKTKLITINSIEDVVEKCPRSIALGFFDGIHVGHRRIIELARDKAINLGIRSVCLSFVDFPNSEAKTILSLDERIEVLSQIGIDEFIVIRFTDAVRNMSPEDFYKKFLMEKFDAQALFSGVDYTFGQGGKGNIELLKKLAKNDAEIHIVDDITLDGKRISSTWIRNAIEEGNMELVMTLLGGISYSVKGVVKEGKKLGRTLGFPTINQSFPSDKYPCRKGVYKSLTIVDGKEYKSISNVGLRPTVENSDNVNCETYIYDFNRNIYGVNAEVKLLEFIRDEKKFSSADELKAQVMSDKEKVANLWNIDKTN